MSLFSGKWFGVVATLISGTLFAVSLDVGPMGPLALLAPIPLLLYALSAPRAWHAALAAAVARALGMTGLVLVYGGILPLPALLSWIGISALVFSLVVLGTRWLANGLPAAGAVFTYPLLLVASESSFGLIAPHGSFGAMGYALVDVLPLLQVASLGGLAALTFCLALLPMTVVVLVLRKERRSAAVAGFVPLLAALLFGALRLAQPHDSQVRVGLVGVDAVEALAYRGEAQDIAAARAFAAQIEQLAAKQPHYIVLPEKQLGGGRAAQQPLEIIAAATRDSNAMVIAGFDEVLGDGTRVNSARILESGKARARYDKRRMIPGLELGYSPGPGSFVEGTRGVAICKDMDFPNMIRAYGVQGVQLLLVPAWDFVKDGRLHSRMAVVRGVENGFAIARAATAGRLTASDRYGRIVAEAVTSPDKPVTLLAELGLKGGGTWYVKLGEAFTWLCLLAATSLLIWRWRRR